MSEEVKKAAIEVTGRELATIITALDFWGERGAGSPGAAAEASKLRSALNKQLVALASDIIRKDAS